MDKSSRSYFFCLSGVSITSTLAAVCAFYRVVVPSVNSTEIETVFYLLLCVGAFSMAMFAIAMLPEDVPDHARLETGQIPVPRE